MDNQQALTEPEKAWLCGFFDGEGCVDLNVAQNAQAKKRNTTKQWIIVPRLTVVNTHYPTIMRWKELLDRAGVGVYVAARKMYSAKHNQSWTATTHGHKRCLKAVKILSAYSVTKKKQFEIMSRWLQHREENYAYTLKDYDLYIEAKTEINGKGPNDSTLRHIYESCTAPEYTSTNRVGVKRGPYRNSRPKDLECKVESGL